MARPKKIDTQIRDAVRVAPQVEVHPDAATELDAYLREEIPKALKKRDEILPRVMKWRRTIDGERASPGVRRSPTTSNLSVPLLIWARVAVRARLVESILENNPMVMVEPVRTTDDADMKSNRTIANALGRFMSTQIHNSRDLNGKNVIEDTASELGDLGGSAIKVIPTPDIVRKIGPTAVDSKEKPALVPIPGHVTWEHISFLDLVYVDGYGTNTQAMPFIGHQFPQTWGEIELYARIGHYDKDIVEQIKAQAKDDESAVPVHRRNHDMIELYLDWDVDNDGIQESLMITWHEKAMKRVSTTWNPFPEGRRPILMGRFDVPSCPKKAKGQGVSEKLEGPQDEVDAIHNIGIEAGKRGIAHVLVIKEGTRAEEEFGGDEDVLPGDIIVTGNPGEDVVAVPLGDPSAGINAIQLEEHTRMYVTRILGLDESRVGNVESGKRVAASVGIATMREGRMIIRSALSSLANLLTEAVYLTIDLYKRYIPHEALAAALQPDEIEALMRSVFTLSDASVRSSFLIRVNAQDAAIAQETRKQEALLVGQALLPYWDRMRQLIADVANPQTPENARQALLTLMSRMEKGIEALLNTVEFINNPDELLIQVDELRRQLESTGGPALPDSNVAGDEPEEPSLIGDLGAGVA